MIFISFKTRQVSNPGKPVLLRVTMTASPLSLLLSSSMEHEYFMPVCLDCSPIVFETYECHYVLCLYIQLFGLFFFSISVV